MIFLEECVTQINVHFDVYGCFVGDHGIESVVKTFANRAHTHYSSIETFKLGVNNLTHRGVTFQQR